MTVPTSRKQRKTMLPTRDAITGLSLLLNGLLAFALVLTGYSWIQPTSLRGTTCLTYNDQTFHGGHPQAKRTGTCWCGHEDQYCMCTPSLAIDLIIASGKEHVWLVRRKDTNQLATMGGFVEVGESVEHAVAREVMEEMGIDLQGQSPRLLGIYSDPRRDNRRHTVSAVFVVDVSPDVQPRAADDAKHVQRIRLSDVEVEEDRQEGMFFADHRTILADYRRSLGGDSNEVKDVFENVIRSTCEGNT